MKSAQELFDDFIRIAQLPVGSSVVLRENKSQNDRDPNWIVASGDLSDDVRDRYIRTVADLREQHPQTDWNGVKEREGQWRLIRAIKKA